MARVFLKIFQDPQVFSSLKKFFWNLKIDPYNILTENDFKSFLNNIWSSNKIVDKISIQFAVLWHNFLIFSMYDIPRFHWEKNDMQRF